MKTIFRLIHFLAILFFVACTSEPASLTEPIYENLEAFPITRLNDHTEGDENEYKYMHESDGLVIYSDSIILLKPKDMVLEDVQPQTRIPADKLIRTRI